MAKKLRFFLPADDKITEPEPPNTGALLRSFVAAESIASAAKAAYDAAQQDVDAIKDMLLLKMKEEGVTVVNDGIVKAVIAESEVPQVKDWDALYKWVARHKAYHMFERRVSVTAWREEIEKRKGTEIPGVVPFNKLRLNISKG